MVELESEPSPVAARVLRHTRANLVGYLAVFLALGGGVAAALPGSNSVRSGDIAKGQVKRSDVAKNAVNGRKVANGALGGADVRESSLTPVSRAQVAADAKQLGGSPPEDIQARVTGTCDDGDAIGAVLADGGVDCRGSAITPISGIVPAGTTKNFNLGVTNLTVAAECHNGSDTEVAFVNPPGGTRTIRWLYSNGGATSTVDAGGSALASGTRHLFDYSGARIEGRFIIAKVDEVVTVNLHAFDGGGSCEIRGTAQATTVP